MKTKDDVSFQKSLFTVNLSESHTELSSLQAIVTGCSSGIGLAITQQLLQLGCNVFGVARRENRLSLMYETFNSQAKPSTFDYLCCDLNDKNTASKILAQIPKTPDILICNAGLALGTSEVSEGNPYHWDQMISTNINATLYVLKEVLPEMIKRRQGHVVILGSIAGHHAYGGGAVYCATKHAVAAIAKSLRQETCDKNIRVTLVSPGMVETEFSLVRFNGDDQKAKDVYRGLTPLSAADISRQVIFALQQPSHVNIEDIVIMPIQQAHPLKVHRNL